MVVLDGKEGQPFDIIGGMAFSSDGRRFVFAAANVRKSFSSEKSQGRAVVDGEPGPDCRLRL